MLTGSIAYRILENESPRTVSVIKTLLEKHPWYADRWRYDIEKLPESQRGEMLFVLAARWADDIRMQAKLQREVKWHYINFPFKPAGEPEDIKPLPPDPDNILSALAENRRVVKSQVSADKQAIALAWLFHLVGDVHQPLHTVQLFSREYPHGDRGGNDVSVRLAPGRAPLELHRLWDSVITTSNNIDRLRNIANGIAEQVFQSWTKRTRPKAAGSVGKGATYLPFCWRYLLIQCREKSRKTSEQSLLNYSEGMMDFQVEVFNWQDQAKHVVLIARGVMEKARFKKLFEKIEMVTQGLNQCTVLVD